VIELRVLVHAGAGFDAPGVGEITGEMLKDGGTRTMTGPELATKVETLGSSLGVDVGRDATELGMGVVRGQLEPALAILSEVLRAPRFDPGELTKLKTRLTEESEDAARSSGTWAAARILFHTLYPAGGPYAVAGLLPSEIAKVSGAGVRSFHSRFYQPSNVEVIVAGDVSADDARKAVEKVFGDWKPGATPPPKVTYPEPKAPDATRVIIANRPKSVQSDCIVTELLPDRHDPHWPAVRVALHVFGGSGTGRLYNDVRETRSLAYRADATYIELAHGAQPLFAYAGTQAPKTADAVQGILDDLGSMRASPPADADVAASRRYLSDIFAVRMETIGAIADLVGSLRTLDLPDDYWDTYRVALRGVTAAQADEQAARFASGHYLILVSGDADVIAAPLARFGDVTVVDPEHDFATLRTLPKNGTP
jgi:predicted Zn-dependent peptidase